MVLSGFGNLEETWQTFVMYAWLLYTRMEGGPRMSLCMATAIFQAKASLERSWQWSTLDLLGWTSKGISSQHGGA